jgi:hypothetical protein
LLHLRHRRGWLELLLLLLRATFQLLFGWSLLLGELTVLGL